MSPLNGVETTYCKGRIRVKQQPRIRGTVPRRNKMIKRVREIVTLRDVMRDDPLLPFDLVTTVAAVAAFLIVLMA